MIIDVHVHLGQARWMMEVHDVAAVRQKIRAAGVDKVITFPFADCGMEANDYVYQETKGQDDFIPAALCDPTDLEAVTKLEHCLKLGMRAIKLHPFCHGYPLDMYQLTDPVFELAGAYKAPILCHIFSDCPFNTAGQAADMATRHPNTNLVALHGGFMWFTWGLIEHAKTRPNLFLETSCLYPKSIADGVNTIGAEHFIYGTDSPWSDQRHDIEKVQLAVKDTASQELILGGNITQLLAATSGKLVAAS